jgi:hypothetical protein
MKPYRLPYRFLLSLFCLAVIHGAVGAAEQSCREELGERRAAELVRQCRMVSPATRPPCNAANSCRMIEDEVLRGCGFGSDARTLFCELPVKAGTFEGVLVAGGGIDDNSVTVRRDDGNRVRAMCDRACGDWFAPSGEGAEQHLKPGYVGKRVAVTVKTEPNNDRIAGPDSKEPLVFLKAIRFVK